MRPRSISFLAAVFSASVFTSSTAICVSGQAAESESHATEAWQLSLQAWRTQHETQVSSRDGWLALAGLEWLKPGINSLGSAADNTIRLPDQAPAHLALLSVIDPPHSDHETVTKAPEAATVQLVSPDGGFAPDFTLDGKPARGGTLVVEGANPSSMAWRGFSFAVLRRGDRFVLRIKDADSPRRANFHGLNWYPPDPDFRVTARWVPFNPPIVQEMATEIGTALQLPTPGLAMFLLKGRVLQLEPVLEDPAGKTLLFVLKDATSASTTYGGGRFLHTGLPDHGLSEPGTLVLDFNRLENPPCAYTNYATCPLPPGQNQLETELKAGEQRYER